MKNKLGFTILVIMLTLGLTVMTWGQGAINNYSLNSGPPTAAALAAGGLTQAQFNQIRNAGAGGFQGWQIREGGLHLVWTGRNETNFTAVARIVGELRTGTRVEVSNEAIFAMNNYYLLILTFRSMPVFYPGVPAGNYPARTMILVIKPW